jgi:hypothetical protein
MTARAAARSSPGFPGILEIAMKKCPECGWEIKDGGVKAKTAGKEAVYCCQECADKAKKKAK